MSELLRLVAAVERIAVSAEMIAQVMLAKAPPAEVHPLLSAIVAEFRGATFTAREVVERSDRLAREAQMRGQRTPDLPHELTRAKIATTHALGRWLADSPAIEKVSTENGSAVWALVSPGIETLNIKALTLLR